MDPPSRPRHLDATGGREVVYCHSCRHEWYKEEHGLRCPRCDGEITEIVIPGDDDPRQDVQDPLESLRRFDRTPNPYHRHGRHHESNSDPEEGDIEEHTLRGAGAFLHNTILSGGGSPRPSPRTPSNNNNPGGAAGGPSDPTDRTFVLRRFHEMLMNDFRVGATGRSGQETLFPEPPMGSPPAMFHRHMTYSSSGGGGGVTMSFAFGSGPANPPPNPFDQYESSPTPRPPTTITFITFRGANSRPRMLNNIMGTGSPSPAGASSMPMPSPGAEAANGTARVGQDLAAILSTLLGALGGPDGVHGDAVYTQEAMDRILTQLMEQNQGSNAPPPASQQAIESLPRKKLDKSMLPEGKGECTICIQDVEIGDEVVELPCTHWFHEECILHWLREHGTCPICRQTVEPEGRQAPGSNSSQPGPSSAPGPGSSSSSSGQARHFHTTFNFGPSMSSNQQSPSFSPGMGGPSGHGHGARNRMSTAEARTARFNVIRSSAGLPPRDCESDSQRVPGYHGRSYGSRSRSPSSHSRLSMFGSGDRDRTRERRASYNAVESPTSGSSSGNGNSSGSGSSGNGSGGQFMGWLRSQFQGRRS